MPGITNTYLKAANTAITSNAVLATIGLSTPIAAGQKKKCVWWIPFTLGATGGIRFQVTVPAGGAAFAATAQINNTVAPGVTIAAQTASAVITNALANAGTHWIKVEAYVENGATAGTVDLQMAQNTSDVLTLTVLEGGSLVETVCS